MGNDKIICKINKNKYFNALLNLLIKLEIKLKKIINNYK